MNDLEGETMTEETQGAAVHPLSIHERRTLSRDGALSPERTIRCTQRGEVFVLNCLFCSHNGGIRDAGGGRRFILCDDPEANASDESVSALMTPTVLCVQRDVGVAAIVKLLLAHAISAVPVVDADGRPIGMVSKTDLVRHIGDDALSTTIAADVMTPLVYSISEQAAAANAAALMAYEGIHHLPVLSSTGRVVGIVSALDVLRWFATRAGFVIPPRDISGELGGSQCSHDT